MLIKLEFTIVFIIIKLMFQDVEYTQIPNNYSNSRELNTEFQKSLKVAGRKRPYFRKNPNELRVPQKIERTDIFVETNLSANTIVKVYTNLIYTLGYSENDLKIKTR